MNFGTTYRLVEYEYTKQPIIVWDETRHEKTCFCHMRTTKAHMSYSRNFKILVTLINWADRFESYLVENPEDRFSCDGAQMVYSSHLLFTNLSKTTATPSFSSFISTSRTIPGNRFPLHSSQQYSSDQSLSWALLHVMFHFMIKLYNMTFRHYLDLF